MNRYHLIRRLRGPLFLLLLGVLALLAQMNILHWSHSWPIFLIYFGAFMLAERAALAADGYPYAGGYGAAPIDAPTTEGVQTSGASETISTHTTDSTSRGVQL
jgi:hypothetical protein